MSERSAETGAMNRAAIEVCEHYWAWVSPAGTSRSAQLCMLCHQPDPAWLNHIVEVSLGCPGECVPCEFAEVPDPRTTTGQPTPTADEGTGHE